MKYIIVTGGLGYIGSNTIVNLLQSGYIPIVLDNLHNSSISIIDTIYNITKKDVLFHQVDISSKEVFRIMEQYTSYNIVGIIHFAALKSVAQSIKNPLSYYHNNINGLLNMLSIMNTHNIKHFIFSSSATVYSSTNTLPFSESQPVGNKLSCPYGRTKYFCEEIIRDFYIANPRKCLLVLRYFNPIGSDPTYQLGDCPRHAAENLFPIIKEVIDRKRQHLSIFGHDYNTRDGTPERDYIHIDDLVQGHLLGFQFLTRQVDGIIEYINLGEGKGTSVMDIIKGFKTFCNIDIPYVYADRRLGDFECVYANCDKAKQLLHWETKKSLQDSTESYVHFIHTLKKINYKI